MGELKIVKRTGKDSDGDITSLCGDGWTGKYLRSVADGRDPNNLDNLPDC